MRRASASSLHSATWALLDMKYMVESAHVLEDGHIVRPRTVIRYRAMNERRSPIDVVRAHMRAEDRRDVEALLATFTEDCYYSVPGLDAHLRGKDEIRTWYEETFAAVPDFRNADERIYEAGERTVFYEARMEGTHLGTWAGWPPTGRRFSTPMLVRIPIAADGLIEAEIVYLDSVHVFRQLGLMPAPGSLQERALQTLQRARGRLSGRRPVR